MADSAIKLPIEGIAYRCCVPAVSVQSVWISPLKLPAYWSSHLCPKMNLAVPRRRVGVSF